MGFFRKKTSQMTLEELRAYLRKTTKAPAFDYCTEDYLHKFFINVGFELNKDDEGFFFKKVEPQIACPIIKGAALANKRIVVEPPKEHFHSTSEMMDKLAPVFEETIKKPIGEIYDDKSYSYPEFLDARLCQYGREDTHPMLQSLYEGENWEFCDLIVNKGNGMNLEEFYQMYYADIDLMAELKKLKNEQGFELYGFNNNPDEMVDFFAQEMTNADGEKELGYTLSLSHSHHRYKGDKWKDSLVGSINDIPLVQVEKELETLKDDNTKVNNPYYKGDMNGRYTIKELKEWTKKCDYEKAVKNMLKTMQGRIR